MNKEKEFVQNFALELTNRTLEEREEIGRKYYQQLQAKEQELQTSMDNYVKLDNQRVKEYNELVDKYNLKEQEFDRLKAELKNFQDMAKKGLDKFKDVGGCWGCGLQLQLNQDIQDIKQLKAEKELLQEEREKAKNYNLEYGRLLIKATNENNQLKAENEILEKVNKNNQEKIKKLNETLQEEFIAKQYGDEALFFTLMDIKEIAESAPAIDTELSLRILEKISEVE